MKTLSLIACCLTLAGVLASCEYDDRPYGYTSAGYRTPHNINTYSSYTAPTYYGTRYYRYDSPYYSGPYGFRTSYPRTYTSNRYQVPVITRSYVADPLSRHMSVGGYGYLPPAPRPAPWPLR